MISLDGRNFLTTSKGLLLLYLPQNIFRVSLISLRIESTAITEKEKKITLNSVSKCLRYQESLKVQIAFVHLWIFHRIIQLWMLWRGGNAYKLDKT